MSAMVLHIVYGHGSSLGAGGGGLSTGVPLHTSYYGTDIVTPQCSSTDTGFTPSYCGTTGFTISRLGIDLRDGTDLAVAPLSLVSPEILARSVDGTSGFVFF